MGIASIGPVMQIAFVPVDFDAALHHWTTVMGVGPFFLFEKIRLEEMRYLGLPSDCVFSLALAYWGDLQVELIRPDNDAPSIYHSAVGRELHHTCVLTDDIGAAKAVAVTAGATVLVEAKVGDDGAVLYVDCGGDIVEILQPTRGTLDLFATIKAAAQSWDGSDPVRRLE